MEEQHCVEISISTLRRRLKDYGLCRRRALFDESQVRARVLELMHNSKGCLGYRNIWHTLKLEGMHVPRLFVQNLLKELDPAAVERRKAHKLSRRVYAAKGPNFVWHCDGYDKLKPYGFPIHGCIDGYSRKILWLHVVKTNNSPTHIAKLYLNCVGEFGGCPLNLVTDLGTENVTIAAMQSFFLDNCGSHRYVASPHNQRIEAWWAMLRKTWSNPWMEFFKGLVEEGLFNRANPLQANCLWFAFAELLDKELQGVKNHWNSHRIRTSRSGTVGGRPDILFGLPARTDAEQCLNFVDAPQLEAVRLSLPHECLESGPTADTMSQFRRMRSELNISQASTREESLRLYFALLQSAEQSI